MVDIMPSAPVISRARTGHSQGWNTAGDQFARGVEPPVGVEPKVVSDRMGVHERHFPDLRPSVDRPGPRGGRPDGRPDPPRNGPRRDFVTPRRLGLVTNLVTNGKKTAPD